MPAKILYSPMALDDLDAIWRFLGIECDNPNAANKTIDAIASRIDMLSVYPESGTPLDSRCIIHSEYRYVSSSHYLVFYRLSDGCVYIDRVMDGRSDYLKSLFGMDESATDLYV